MNVLLSDISSDLSFGYTGSRGIIEELLGSLAAGGFFSLTGGTFVDFAIRNLALNITRASEGTAEMVVSGPTDSSYSGNPVALTDYWQNITIAWAPGNNNDMVVNMGGPNDGFAPVSEPATMLLLGTGLMSMAAAARRKKMIKKS